MARLSAIGADVARFMRPGAYAFLLDQAATTGYLPKLDRFGRPCAATKNDELSNGERMKALEYLLDKVVPAAKAVEAPSVIDPLLLASDPAEVGRMSSADLVRLATAGGDGTDAEAAEQAAIEAEFRPLLAVPPPDDEA